MSHVIGKFSEVQIQAHQKPNNRMLNWAFSRKKEIKQQIEQLQLEDELLGRVMAEFEAKVCGYCGGSGIVMRPILGCECDGPRQHTCDKCNGTGEPPK